VAAPRWEYRVWHDAPPPLPLGPVEERTDIYLLHRAMTARMVKVREGMLDVKEMVDCSGGLQRWMPAGRYGFPLGAGQLAAVLCLDQSERAILGEDLSSPEVLRERLAQGTGTAIVSVSKRRVLDEVHDCRRETAQVRIHGRWHGSQVLEHPRAERVRSAIRALGWPEAANESYAQRLGREDQPAMASSSQCMP
jgi:hypothetical protein